MKRIWMKDGISIFELNFISIDIFNWFVHWKWKLFHVEPDVVMLDSIQFSCFQSNRLKEKEKNSFRKNINVSGSKFQL